MQTSKTFVVDKWDGSKFEHSPRHDTPSHYGTVEFRKSRAGGSVKMVTRFSLAKRDRSDLVVQS